MNEIKMDTWKEEWNETNFEQRSTDFSKNAWGNCPLGSRPSTQYTYLLAKSQLAYTAILDPGKFINRKTSSKPF